MDKKGSFLIAFVLFSLAIFTITGRRIGLKQRVVMQETIAAPHVGGMVRMVGFIVRGTLCVEADSGLSGGEF